MRQFFRRLKVRQKLFILLAIALLGLVALSITNSVWLASQNSIQQHLTTLNAYLYQKEKIGYTSNEWRQYLNSAQDNFTILNLAIYNPEGDRLSATHTHLPLSITQESLNETSSKLSLLAGPNLTFLVELEVHTFSMFMLDIMAITFILIIPGALLIYLILNVVDRLITRPILSLIDTTNEIALEQNYALRAKRFYPDEIGTLSENFNYMLNRVEKHEQMLRSEKEKAEQARQRAIELSRSVHETNEQLASEVKIRMRIERKLTEFQKYLNNIINSMPSGIIAIDDTQKITEWNRGATDLTLVEKEKAILNPIEEACSFLSMHKRLIQQSLDDQIINKIERIPFKQGKYPQFLDITIYPLLDTTTNGAVIRIDDVTRRSQIEDMMVQSEKMMSLGGLAAGMAHEINNPLGAIIHTIQNIQRRLNPNVSKNQEIANKLGLDITQIRGYIAERDIFSFLDNILEAGSRASTIVSNMLQFSRQTAKNLQPQNLNQIVERAINIAKNEYDLSSGYDLKSIDLITDFDHLLPDVPCIPSEIEQVVINLLKNAAQALRDFKQTKEFNLDWYAHIKIKTRLRSGQAEITVADNGPGMNEDTRRHIFEPFFTTKEVGTGTGLGLSVSYFILTSHHQGSMHVNSTPGQGTRFVIRLPLTPVRVDDALTV